MIGKAVFWLGLLVLLTPHEPDLGLRRPSATIMGPANEGYAAPQPTAGFATNVWRPLLSLREDFLRQAPQMRAEIRDSLKHRDLEAEGRLRLAPRSEGVFSSQF